MAKYSLPKSVQELADQFNLLPGIGPKSATRLAIYLATLGKQNAQTLEARIDKLLSKVEECSICGNISESAICEVCADPDRDNSMLMVVENSIDLQQIESSGVFNGKYLVLGGLVSPINGITAIDLNIDKLVGILREREELAEVILALSANVEGEATSMFIKESIRNIIQTLHISRLAKGLPTGASIEYLDTDTIRGALSGRKEID